MSDANPQELSNIKAIRKVFDSPPGPPVTMRELKDLTTDDRQELGDMCREVLAQK
jgi:hypothetical protein